LVTYRLHDFWYEAKKSKKKICERKRASNLERHGNSEGFQAVIYLGNCMRKVHSTHDVRAIDMTVTVWSEELEPTYSQFRYHPYR